MAGYILIDRDWVNHPIVGIKNCERHCLWNWMLSQARWKDGQVPIGTSVMIVKRGQILTSFRFIQKATGISIAKIRSSLKLFESGSMISTQNDTRQTLITICNYDKYQDAERYLTQRKTHKSHSANTQVTHRSHSANTELTQNRIPDGIQDNTTQQPLESVSAKENCCVVESDPDDLLDIPPSLDKRGEGSPNPVVQVIAAFDQAIADAWGDNRRRPYPNQTDTLEAKSWLDAGLDLEHIKTVFAGTMASLHGQGKEPPGLLKYFSGFIANRPTAPRIEPRNGGNGGYTDYEPPSNPDLVEYNGRNIIEWQARLDGFRDRQLWLDTWGPKPDDPACEAPPWLVTEFQEESGMETPQEMASEEG